MSTTANDGDNLSPLQLDAVEIDRIFREESGQAVASPIRVFGDIDLAEDAVQDVFLAALGRWAGRRSAAEADWGGHVTT